MLLAPSLNQARAGILALNLALTLTLCGHAVYRFVLHRDYREFDGELEELLTLEPGIFTPRLAMADAPPPGRLVRGDSFVQFLPAPPPVGVGEAIVEKPEPVDEVGPLEGRWNYESFILFPDRPEMNLAVLRKVSKVPRGRTSVRRPNARSRRSPTTPRHPPGEARVVRKYHRWILDEKSEPDEVGLSVWIVSVSKDEVVYESAGSRRQYRLPRKVRPIYVGSAAGEESKDDRRFFYRHGEMPDPLEAFEKRHSAGEGD